MSIIKKLILFGISYNGSLQQFFCNYALMAYTVVLDRFIGKPKSEPPIQIEQTQIIKERFKQTVKRMNMQLHRLYYQYSVKAIKLCKSPCSLCQGKHRQKGSNCFSTQIRSNSRYVCMQYLETDKYSSGHDLNSRAWNVDEGNTGMTRMKRRIVLDCYTKHCYFFRTNHPRITAEVKNNWNLCWRNDYILDHSTLP